MKQKKKTKKIERRAFAKFLQFDTAYADAGDKVVMRRLQIIHEHGDDKQALISQLLTVIDGLRSEFKDFKRG